MSRSGRTKKNKKDNVQTKSSSGAIVKAKDKRKKFANLKKMKEKIGEEIQKANVEFTELHSKMICEKENKNDATEKNSKESKMQKAPVLPTVCQEKQVEETTSVLANL